MLLIPSNTNAEYFDLEIKSLLMVMQNQKIKLFNKSEEIIRYRSFPVDKCRCIINVKKYSKVKSFEVDVCTKKIIEIKT